MRRTDKKVIERLIKEWQASGESKSGFAASKGISPNTFYYWTKKHQPFRLKQEPKNGFQPIIIDEPSILGHGHPTAVIHYPSGTRLEFHTPLDGTLLKFLIA